MGCQDRLSLLHIYVLQLILISMTTIFPLSDAEYSMSGSDQLSAIRNSNFQNSKVLKCPSCFASCEELAHCHWKCKNSKNICFGKFCASRMDAYHADGFFMLRMGCTDKATVTNYSSMKNYPPGMHQGRGSNMAGNQEKMNAEKNQQTDTERSCYSSGTVSMPVEHCFCRSDMCTLVSGEISEPAVTKRSHRCCIVSPELLPSQWHTSCPDECHGSHCITDFIAKRKQCGMDYVMFQPEVIANFDSALLPRNKQVCLQYETAGTHQHVSQCACVGRYCNERVSPPDYHESSRTLRLPMVECHSCRKSGSRSVVTADRSINRSNDCKTTCKGHYCLISLQTAQLVQYYDEIKDEASLPEIEPDYFDLHSGCVTVNYEALVKKEPGCDVEWMKNNQPFVARCACTGTKCNSLDFLVDNVAKTLNLTQNWWHSGDLVPPTTMQTAKPTQSVEDLEKYSSTPRPFKESSNLDNVALEGVQPIPTKNHPKQTKQSHLANTHVPKVSPSDEYFTPIPIPSDGNVISKDQSNGLNNHLKLKPENTRYGANPTLVPQSATQKIAAPSISDFGSNGRLSPPTRPIKPEESTTASTKSVTSLKESITPLKTSEDTPLRDPASSGSKTKQLFSFMNAYVKVHKTTKEGHSISINGYKVRPKGLVFRQGTKEILKNRHSANLKLRKFNANSPKRKRPFSFERNVYNPFFRESYYSPKFNHESTSEKSGFKALVYDPMLLASCILVLFMFGIYKQ